MDDVSYLSNKEICALLAKRIKNERIAQNLTQEDFAKKSETSLDTYRKFEQKGVTSLVKLVAYIKALNKVTLFQELFDFEKERKEADIEEFISGLDKNKRKIVRKKTQND
jgi:transcriptional regulator with XRE-family HTH domain